MKKPNKLLKALLLFMGILFVLILILTMIPPRQTVGNDLCELSAGGMLKRLYHDQICFKEKKIKDLNNNQIYEFGTINDWNDWRNIDEQRFADLEFFYSNFDFIFISKGNLSLNGPRGGYYYIIYVPDDIVLAEQYWCCYAFPARSLITGVNTFFINQAGKVWQSTEKMIYGMDINEIPRVEDTYKGTPFISEIDVTKWIAPWMDSIRNK